MSHRIIKIYSVLKRMRKYAIALIVIFVILILAGTAACLYFFVFRKKNEVNEEITKAEGGNIIGWDGDDKYHVFNESGTFQITQGGKDIHFLVIAGGGAGGGVNGTTDTGKGSGGGGAGGYRTSYGTISGRNSVAEAPLMLSPGSYTVTVGGGGSENGTTDEELSGGDSMFQGLRVADDGTINYSYTYITSIGGGYGGYGEDDKKNGGDGGSGGGAFTYDNDSSSWRGFATGQAADGTPNQGFDGFDTTGGSTGAGGGGAGGGDGNGKDGGVGIPSSITGTAIYRGGGGGGGGVWDVLNGFIGQGGQGGGANGNDSGFNGHDGVANTGGGGGGTRSYTNAALGGNGGSGVVILRYRYK